MILYKIQSMDWLLFFITAFAAYLPCLHSIIQVAPSWRTSNYIQAASNSIINGTSTTGSGTTPTATLPFPNAFAAEPNLAYGMSYYESSDNLGSEMFEVNKTSLTTTSFSVKVQISGNTDIWIIVVRYIAVSKTFPHHLNSFDNVPVNYNNGALTAFSARSLTQITYTNTINYTLQVNSIGSSYNTFNAPYSNIKILLFMTSMFFDGQEPMSNGSAFAPIDIRVTTSVISVDQYRITVTFGYYATCSRLHYSMIIYDQADVEASGEYQLLCLRVDMPTIGGDVAIPYQLVGNAIMGWTDFSSYRTQTSIIFYLIFQNLTNGSYGIHMPISVSRNPSKVPITRFGFTLFYLRTWICPNQTYFNQSLNLCTQCIIPDCSQCFNQTSCHTCASGYTKNNSTLQCDPIPCTIASCLSCLNSTFCQECNGTSSHYLASNGSCSYCDSSLDYFINGTSLDCQPCELANCLVCQSLTQCSICNTTNDYFLNSTSQSCQICSIVGCIDCINMTACLTCNSTLFLNTTDSQCYPCPLIGCSLCSDLSSCLNCSTGYLLNTTDLQCQPCTLVGCLNCTDLQTCGQCNSSDNYVLTANLTCQQCQVSLGYFANDTTNQCEQCTLQQCVICQSLTQCVLCNANNSYYLSNGTCVLCDSSIGYFINGSTLECEPCQLVGCSNCSSLATCLQCNATADYFLNSTTDQCSPCSLPNCLTCQSLAQCLECNETSQYFLNQTTSLCQPCSLEGCLSCSSLSACAQCDTNSSYGFDYTSANMSQCGLCNVSCICDGYGLPWVGAQCTPLCGDGLIRAGEGCDDGNGLPGDGCSAGCLVERDYQCEGQPSNCTFVPTIAPLIVEGLRGQREGCNGFVVNIPKNLLIMGGQNSISIPAPGVQLESVSQDNSYIYAHYTYSRDIIGQKIVILIGGSQSEIVYEPVLPALYYSEHQCRIQEDIKRLLLGVQYTSYVALLASVFTCKIIGLELFGVLQLAYFSLAEHSFLNIYLAPLLKLSSFNGFNVGLLPETSSVPKLQKQMKISSTFLNNFNVMFLLTLLQLFVAGVVCVVSRMAHSGKAYTIGLNLLKQGFITILLFNAFNISFSAGVHIKYANKDDRNYGISTAAMVLAMVSMVVATILMEFTSSRTYGQFKNKFKQTFVCRLFIPISLAYRIALGLYVAMRSEQNEGSLVILSVVILFMLYLLTNLPYNDAYHNYRCAVMHCAMAVILFTANYYRSIKSNTPMEIKARIYGPAILELVMIVICVTIAVLVLAYEICIAVAECIRDNRQSKIVNQKTEESDMDINANGRKMSTQQQIM